MAKVFLNTNKVIDVALRKPELRKELENHQIVVSPLSIHILCYADKRKVPDYRITEFVDQLSIVDLVSDLLNKSLYGPTSDLEDNIQLHSAAAAECDYFLTSDKRLLQIKFFGKTQLVSRLPV